MNILCPGDSNRYPQKMNFLGSTLFLANIMYLLQVRGHVRTKVTSKLQLLRSIKWRGGGGGGGKAHWPSG